MANKRGINIRYSPVSKTHNMGEQAMEMKKDLAVEVLGCVVIEEGDNVRIEISDGRYYVVNKKMNEENMLRFEAAGLTGTPYFKLNFPEYFQGNKTP